MNEVTTDRLGIGGNEPPLEERTLLEFDMALASHDGLLVRLDEMVARADRAKACENDVDAGAMGDFIKIAATAAKTIEAEREALNRPLLTTQRMLKARADGYAQKATGAAAKVRGLLDGYLAEKERKRVEEERRLAEIARQAEAERQRVIREAEAEARRVAEVERQRLQAIADEDARVERERLQAIADAEAAERGAEAEAVVVEAAVVEVQPEPVYVPEPMPVFETRAPERGPVRGDYGAAVSVTTTWHVKVENIRQVPDVFLRNPAVVEALEKVLGASVRGKNGLRDIKGCRIWSTTGSAVR